MGLTAEVRHNHVFNVLQRANLYDCKECHGYTLKYAKLFIAAT